MYRRPINRRQPPFKSVRLIAIILFALSASCCAVGFAGHSGDGEQSVVPSEDVAAAAQGSDAHDALAQDGASESGDAVNEERTPPPREKTLINSNRESSTADRTTNGRHSTSSSILQTFSALAIMLGVIVVLGVLAKRVSPNYSRGSKTIETLDQTALDRKWRLHTIRWGARVLLIATGGDSCVKLAEVSDQAEIDELLKTRLNSK